MQLKTAQRIIVLSFEKKKGNVHDACSDWESGKLDSEISRMLIDGIWQWFRA